MSNPRQQKPSIEGNELERNRTLARRDGHWPRILRVEETKARALFPLLEDAGYEMLEFQHDEVVYLRDHATCQVISLTDQGGDRLTIRLLQTIRPTASREDREELAGQLGSKMWAHFRIDDDGDLEICHNICCRGGVHLPNLMQTIKQFLNLCVFVRESQDPNGLFKMAEEPNDGREGDNAYKGDDAYKEE
jgi:hypothetical protein